MATLEKHFVTFYSPGSFTAETSRKPIDSWNTEDAIAMAKDIKERHGAVPYGFRFSTRSRSEDDLDSKESAKSVMYYLGGEIQTLETLDDVIARGDPSDSILISNMRCNKWNRIIRIIVNTNSWTWSQPLNDDDVVLDVDLTAPGHRVDFDGDAVTIHGDVTISGKIASPE